MGDFTPEEEESALNGVNRNLSTYEQLRDVNPRIVCCSLSGFGMTGPRASEGGYDYMMQGLAGWQSLTGEPGGPPTKSGLSLVDLSGGYGLSGVGSKAGGPDYLLQFLDPRASTENTLRQGFAPE